MPIIVLSDNRFSCLRLVIGTLEQATISKTDMKQIKLLFLIACMLSIEANIRPLKGNCYEVLKILWLW